MARQAYKTAPVFKIADAGKLTLEMGVGLSSALLSHFKKTAALAKDNLEANDSVRTGLLRKAIAAKSQVLKNKGGDSYRVWAAVGVNKEIEGHYKGQRVRPYKYAHLVEYGHNGVAPKPFLRLALASRGGENEIRNIAAEALEETAKATE